MPEKVTDFEVFVKEGEGSEIHGYLFSICVVQENARLKVKPKWQIDVCVAIPNHRRGGGQA